ncbi:hypothetical protein B0T24DRAFT_27787 [Lasiosphaeria ovina]|uniref:Secreted protein n=1 Tax=Lasiosphaeria ovina TaxID=92902 RepID=A0AAE0TXB7_9PEZI|nr:hypothetical protein B0T24DRAFT_27787 [Lasiosphaeria ovina]
MHFGRMMLCFMSIVWFGPPIRPPFATKALTPESRACHGVRRRKTGHCQSRRRRSCGKKLMLYSRRGRKIQYCGGIEGEKPKPSLYSFIDSQTPLLPSLAIKGR